MIPNTASRSVGIAFDVWLAEVDGLINREIRRCYPRAWKEDHITYNWLEALTQEFQFVAIEDLELPFTVSWEAYKADGPIETRYGDIGIIVDFGFSVNGASAMATGVGFLEAKRIIVEDGSYSNMGWEQLRREAANIAGHRVLFYDFQSIDRASLNLQAHGFCPHLESAPYNRVHGAVAITQHILACKNRSRGVAGLGVPLGYQLCGRYLRGLDLDYTLDRAELLADIPGSPQFLIIANVQGEGNVSEPGGTPLPRGYSPLVRPEEARRGEEAAMSTTSAEGFDQSGLQDLLDKFRYSSACGQAPKIKGKDEDDEITALA